MCAAIETASRNALDDTRRRDSTASRSWRCAGVTLSFRKGKGGQRSGEWGKRGVVGDGNELVADSLRDGYWTFVLLDTALNLERFVESPTAIRGAF